MSSYVSDFFLEKKEEDFIRVMPVKIRGTLSRPQGNTKPKFEPTYQEAVSKEQCPR